MISKLGIQLRRGMCNIFTKGHKDKHISSRLMTSQGVLFSFLLEVCFPSFSPQPQKPDPFM